MKREFLEELGLTKDQTDAVMAEHGRGIEALKVRNTELEGVNTINLSLKDENERLKNELEAEKSAYSSFKRGVICELVDNAHPSSSLARDELIRRLEACDNDCVYSTLNDLRASDPSAFSAKTDHPVFSSFSRNEEAPAPINFVRRR